MDIFTNNKKAIYDFKRNFFVRLVFYFEEYTKPKLEAISIYFKEYKINSLKDIEKEKFKQCIKTKYDDRLSNDILQIDEEIFRCFVTYALSVREFNVIPNKKLHFLWVFLHFLYENINLVDRLSQVILINSDEFKLMLTQFMKNHEEDQTFNKYNVYNK